MSFITSLFGGKEPKTSVAPIEDIATEGRKAKRSRSALLETAGGVMGEEIMSGGTSARSTLFGN